MLTSLDLQHEVWLLTLQGNLSSVPLSDDDGSILDIGCGTGTWAYAMARKFPYKDVIAFDLTPPGTSRLSNLSFVKANAEETWRFEKRFGFIHGRMLTSGIHDWPKLLHQCFENLKPGGTLELLDICHPFNTMSNINEESSEFLRWGRVAERCWFHNGLDYRATNKHTTRLEALGFVDVQETEYKWPLGPWADGDIDKQIGILTLRNTVTFLRLAGKDIITKDSILSDQEAQNLVNAALEDLTEDGLTKKFYLTMYHLRL